MQAATKVYSNRKPKKGLCRREGTDGVNTKLHWDRIRGLCVCLWTCSGWCYVFCRRNGKKSRVSHAGWRAAIHRTRVQNLGWPHWRLASCIMAVNECYSKKKKTTRRHKGQAVAFFIIWIPSDCHLTYCRSIYEICGGSRVTVLHQAVSEESEQVVARDLERKTSSEAKLLGSLWLLCIQTRLCQQAVSDRTKAGFSSAWKTGVLET